MPEVNQYFFNHGELLEILVKQADVHEGRWMLVMSFGFTAGNFSSGPMGSPPTEQIIPGALIQVQKIGIQRAASDTPEQLIVDAAVVNPVSR